MIELSIALVTRNRPDNLNRVLSSIFAEYPDIYEVVVSDDSNDESLKEQNKLISKKYGCKYIAGPQLGLYANRNCALKECSGTHIRTMDDDHTFPESHFAECLETIRKEPETIWTIGEYNHMVKINDRKIPLPISGQLHPRGFSYEGSNNDEYYGISCGGSIYPRKVIDSKMFNCDYYKFGKLYLEYGARLKFKGFKLKPLRTTYIIHNDDRLKNKDSLMHVDIIECTHFAMFCLSFKYMPSFHNKLLTITQVILNVISYKVPFKTVINAYRMYKKLMLMNKL
jgi:glycosyltransferase involved in cell wall biosynthesis